MLGLLWCFFSILLAVQLSCPIIVNKFSSIAVAVTFFMLFLGRNAALKSVMSPIEGYAPYQKDIEHETTLTFQKLKKFKQTDPLLVIQAAECLVMLESKRQKALNDNHLQVAKNTQLLIDQSILELSPSKRLVVETLFDAKVAKAEAQSNRTAIRLHIDLLRKEAVPLALLSVVSTLLTGFGDDLAKLFI